MTHPSTAPTTVATEIAVAAATAARTTIPATPHRTRDAQEIARAVVEGLGVIEALNALTDQTSAHGFVRSPGHHATLSRDEQISDIRTIARTIARYKISTNYASTGGNRTACADMIAEEVLAALDTAGLLVIDPA